MKTINERSPFIYARRLVTEALIFS